MHIEEKLMRTILLFIVYLSCLQVSNGQEKLFDILPIQNGIVIYSNVIQVDGVNKNELYLRAKKWFVMTYNSANDVIQLDDLENGNIIAKGNFKIAYYSREPFIDHTISISVRDGRFKYEIKSLIYSDKQGDEFEIENFPKAWAGKKKLYEAINRDINLMIESLIKGMKSEVDEDW